MSVLDNPIRGRFNAWFFRAMDGYVNRLLRRQKRRILASLPSTIVEIGPGTGANFRYYRRGTVVIAIEPNRRMHARLHDAANHHGIDLRLVARGAEDAGLDRASVDAVISTLVLCTVADPDATLAEIRRVLRPGGSLRFLEHVAAPRGSWLRRVQEAVHRPWHWLFEGCHTNRDTLGALEGAGFASLDAERTVVRSPFVPINLQIAGVATR